jgi:replicative DNA helicase
VNISKVAHQNAEENLYKKKKIVLIFMVRISKKNIQHRMSSKIKD